MVVPTRLIEATVHAPSIVEVPPKARTVSITMRTELYNISERDVVLHAPSGKDQYFWHVLNENHREVLRWQPYRKGGGRKKKTDVHPIRSQTIAAGHSTHETETLVLKTARLKDGHTYTIRCEVWGQIAETEFIVVRIAPPSKRKPTSKKKSAASRKKVAGKTAKK